ncbi:MAG: tRNA (adenosine(37)-N6)-threonylcarbamoyltransferase complex transferase subunit TsaD [Candidatus Pacebacteria bacterium]|jgi:N6-L-threonylcarbamoyladenine synthase|nr:tRNA (adenosine(37)-N6)-threonylcarbamoyltransferase complex transferase subunit TsaD [Candidatus Paceibacterota bacterium]
MHILSIETSCDETALSVLKASGSLKKPAFTILANEVSSQIAIHAQFGGVFPMMAKREHAKNAIPVLKKILHTARLEKKSKKETLTKAQIKKIQKILMREPELLEQFLVYIPKIKKPKIDLIAVTNGPGLEPALWVGISFAKALAIAWNIPVMPVNHMEGHIVSSIIALQKKTSEKNKRPSQRESIQPVAFPAVSLLVSGGHTEIVVAKNWMHYTIVGETVDDAAGEAFDKVARMLGLPYPGGPEISRLAKEGKENPKIILPRPMLHTQNFDFSFSGLKTAVLYLIRDLGTLDTQIKKDIAYAFQNAVVDVLLKKTMRAVTTYKAKTLLLGGGVASNSALEDAFRSAQKKDFPKLALYFPRKDLSTDNALMIGIAGYFRFLKRKTLGKTSGREGVPLASIKADGGMRLQ